MALAATMALPSRENTMSRQNDWRNGAIIYQVFPDRFVTPTDLASRKCLYPAPQTLHEWSVSPKASAYDPILKTYPHVLDFWGGTLKGVSSRLDYIRELGADVLYLTPIFKSISNHKYDTEDYFQVDPQLGTSADLSSLIRHVHESGMKFMLDGVFNHIGYDAPLFQEALKDPHSKHRSWFFIGDEYPGGYRTYAGVAGMPGWRLEDEGARKFLWGAKNSVVQTYLRQGIDGWRLDVGFELGPGYLGELTRSAHLAKPGSAVVGEISGYPSNWFPSVDGVFNFFAMNTAIDALNGRISGGRAGRMLQDMVADAGIENILKSWLLVDNHDTARFANIVPDPEQRRLARILQFTLPGSPVIYYGSELGMTGAGDPEDRAPMRWDLVDDKNLDLTWTRKLTAVRRAHPALKVGDFTSLETDKLLAFTRTTENLRDSVIVVVNPLDAPVTEAFPTRIGRLMSWGPLEDVLTGHRVMSITGLMNLKLEPHSAMILVPITTPSHGYSPYNRVH